MLHCLDCILCSSTFNGYFWKRVQAILSDCYPFRKIAERIAGLPSFQTAILSENMKKCYHPKLVVLDIHMDGQQAILGNLYRRS